MVRRFWPGLLISLVPERQNQPLPKSWQGKSEGWGSRMSPPPISLGCSFPPCRKTGSVMCIHDTFNPLCTVCVYWEFWDIWEIQTLSKCLLCKMDTKKCSGLWKKKWLLVFLCWMKRGQKSFCSSTKEPIKQKQNTRVPRVQQQGGSALGLRSVTTWQHWVGAKVFSVLCMLEGSALNKNVTEEEKHARGRGMTASAKASTEQRG